ncbi:uncharacterized protein LOC124363621 [Homalodisca vitripennis]|uniref:uncharacterized protein LOC124363621 n=1 Tax=Homalodisca vitripennis TaxID=197043 RepID=UPI001EEB9F4C|nr:uncharacterized protein LOC124363621 [Homalodisca vitripennis]
MAFQMGVWRRKEPTPDSAPLPGLAAVGCEGRSGVYILYRSAPMVVQHLIMYALVCLSALVAVAAAGIVAPVVPVVHAPLAHSSVSVVRSAVVHPAPVVPVVRAPLIHHAPVVPVVRAAPLVHAAPVVHAAPLLHAPVVHHGPVLVH